MYKVENRKFASAEELEAWLNEMAEAGYRLVGVAPADRGARFIFELAAPSK